MSNKTTSNNMKINKKMKVTHQYKNKSLMIKIKLIKDNNNLKIKTNNPK